VEAVRVRAARPDEIYVVVGLWQEAGYWLSAHGIDQWQYPPRRAVIEANIAAKDECWICESNRGDVIGTITVDRNADPEFWAPSDSPDDALYVHRMIVRREAAGTEIGSALMDWASHRAAAAGKQWLRLDAWRSNPRLQHYYAERGFELVRTVELRHRNSGALFQRPAGVVLGRGPRITQVDGAPQD
jgi:GNAT superfamily N-acetyltransferase